MRRALSYSLVITMLGCAIAMSTATPAFAKQIANDPQVIVTHDRAKSVTGTFRDIYVSDRSWYGATLNLLTRVQTPVRSFDGNNVGIEMTCSSPSGGGFTVTLYRSAGGSGSRIGSATFACNGFTKATWPNVGSGS